MSPCGQLGSVQLYFVSGSLTPKSGREKAPPSDRRKPGWCVRSGRGGEDQTGAWWSVTANQLPPSGLCNKQTAAEAPRAELRGKVAPPPNICATIRRSDGVRLARGRRLRSEGLRGRGRGAEKPPPWHNGLTGAWRFITERHHPRFNKLIRTCAENQCGDERSRMLNVNWLEGGGGPWHILAFPWERLCSDWPSRAWRMVLHCSLTCVGSCTVAHFSLLQFAASSVPSSSICPIMHHSQHRHQQWRT